MPGLLLHGSPFHARLISTVEKGKEGMHGYLVLEGFSTTILLERGKRMDVFCEMSLQEVAKEVTDGIINKSLPLVNKPAYTGLVNFLMQYNESDWEFLKRLSAISGETLFYTGRDLVFGQYNDWKPMEVTYDKEISHFQSGARLLANQYTQYQYLPLFNEILTQDAPQRIENANDFVNSAYLRGKELTESIGNNQTTEVGSDIQVTASNMKVTMDQNADVNVGEKLTLMTDSTDLFANGGDFIVKSVGRALVQGEKDARISKG